MATHSNILGWRIPWTEEPGGLQSMGLRRVGYDCATNTHTEFRVSALNVSHGTEHSNKMGQERWYLLLWLQLFLTKG